MRRVALICLTLALAVSFVGCSAPAEKPDEVVGKPPTEMDNRAPAELDEGGYVPPDDTKKPESAPAAPEKNK